MNDSLLFIGESWDPLGLTRVLKASQGPISAASLFLLSSPSHVPALPRLGCAFAVIPRESPGFEGEQDPGTEQPLSGGRGAAPVPWQKLSGAWPSSVMEGLAR